jgi:hypothetical protein
MFFALFLQRLTFSDKLLLMSEISAKTCLRLHLKFTLFVRDLKQNVNVSAVKHPNIISFVKCIEGFFFSFAVREDRHEYSKLVLLISV